MATAYAQSPPPAGPAQEPAPNGKEALSQNGYGHLWRVSFFVRVLNKSLSVERLQPRMYTPRSFSQAPTASLLRRMASDRT